MVVVEVVERLSLPGGKRGRNDEVEVILLLVLPLRPAVVGTTSTGIINTFIFSLSTAGAYHSALENAFCLPLHGINQPLQACLT